MACLTKSGNPGAKIYRLKGVLSLQCLAFAAVESSCVLRTSQDRDDLNPEVFERKTRLLVKFTENVFNECEQFLMHYSDFVTPEFGTLDIQLFGKYWFNPGLQYPGTNVRTFGGEDGARCPYPYHYVNYHCQFKSIIFMGWEFHCEEELLQFYYYKIVIFALKYREFFDEPFVSNAVYDDKVFGLERRIREFREQGIRLDQWLNYYNFECKNTENDQEYDDV